MFARTLRAPAYGARLTRYDESVASQPGIVAVLPFRYPGDEGLDRVERLETMPGDFIAVVAEREDQALRAVEQLWESAEWELGDPLPTTSDEVNDWLLANGKDLELQEDHANIEEEYQAQRMQAAEVVSATFRIPYQSYAPISPAWALADVQDDRATVWSATQAPFGSRWMVAQALGFERDDQVQVISGPSSGLYGRRDDYDQEVDVEAALISQAVGRPVRLQWSRQNEFVWSQYRPAQIVTVEGALTDAGHLGGLKADVWTAIRGVHPLGPTSALRMRPTTSGHAPDRLRRRRPPPHRVDAERVPRQQPLRPGIAPGRIGGEVQRGPSRVPAQAHDRRAGGRSPGSRGASRGWQEYSGSSGRGMGVCFALYSAPERPSSTYGVRRRGRRRSAIQAKSRCRR